MDVVQLPPDVHGQQLFPGAPDVQSLLYLNHLQLISNPPPSAALVIRDLLAVLVEVGVPQLVQLRLEEG